MNIQLQYSYFLIERCTKKLSSQNEFIGKNNGIKKYVHNN